MIVQKHIRKKAEGFGKLSPVFLEAADYALNNQWISVDEDLPCNPKYLKQEEFSPWVIVITEEGEIFFAQMMFMRGKWVWHSHFSREHNNICYWMMIPIPERFEHTWEIKI